MAVFLTYYRNRSESDTETYQVSLGSDALFINDTGFTNSGYAFVIWNTSSDGTGTNVPPGTSTDISGVIINRLYAIWGPDTEYKTTTSELSSVADAIRQKGNTTASLTYPEDFVTAIQNITTSANLQAKTNINPTTSSQTITPDSGYDGLSSVQINAMPSGSATLPDEFVVSNAGVTISNGTVTLDTFIENVSPVVTAGYVSSGTPQDVYLEVSGNIQMMTLPTSASSTSSGTAKAIVTPSTSAQYINIPTGYNNTAVHYAITGDADLVASNIKKDVTIFGVTGTYEGSGGMSVVTTQDSHGGDIVTITGNVVQPPCYNLITSTEYTIANFTSTTATSHATISLGSSYYTSNKIIYVKIRDKAGPRAGYFVGSDTYFFNYQSANNTTTTLTYAARAIHRLSTSNVFSTYPCATTTGYGVYGYSITSAGDLAIYKRYSSSYSLTIDGTYVVEVYELDYAPNAGNPFNYSYPSS